MFVNGPILFQKFFGTIRRAGGQNDHPSMQTFSELYNLLSVYNILKPPKFGNCSAELENTDHVDGLDHAKHDFDFFLKTNEVNYQKSFKKNHRKRFEDSLKDNIKEESWSSGSIEYLGEEHFSNKAVDNLIFSNTGYLCRVMQQKEVVKKCETCLKAFQTVPENSIFPVSNLIELRTEGGLIYPNLKLFNIIYRFHHLIMPYMEYCEDTMDKVLEDLKNNKIDLTFPCRTHKVEVLSETLFHYLWTKMNHFKRDLQQRQPLESAKLNKAAKLKKS